MAIHNIELGRPYYCREETTGSHYAGLLKIEQDNIEVRLFSFGKSFHIKLDWLVLRTEENNVITLLDNISGGRGTNSWVRGVPIHFIRILSNFALAGRTPWNPIDLARHIQFSVENSSDTLLHVETHDKVANSKFGADVQNKIFSKRISDMEITAWYSVSGSTEFEHPTKIEPILSIDFDDGHSPLDCRGRAQMVVRFFSAVLGARTRALDVNISRSTMEEQAQATTEKDVKEHYRIFELRLSADERPRDKDLWAGQQFSHSRNDEELNALINCLTVWIEREGAWKSASILMLEAMSLSNEMSPNRLINACKWFEQIPSTKPAQVIRDTDAKTIADAANIKAIELGYRSIANRLLGALKAIRTETRAEQISRSVAEITKAFGNSIFDGEINGYLEKAYAFRGQMAHGHFSPETDAAYYEFAKSIHAMESICYLLTIKDLPMTGAGRERIKRLPIVRNYSLSYIPS